ncbi:Uncharacterized [Moorella glycerini]|uniref:Uncharacterized protein n=2 Tax=Neomoorella TaxID=44260 RepID=A0A2T0ALU5_9FIRM|nr:hypothetical protein [Moorella sp. (in: firmicutes)]PRR68949.1 hypothetical protein MOST_32310 [Moorella stamsii]PRR69714.1 hypothetical protein MOHU_22540 [Moorella humiferrea]CEP67570.1 Uncharacterized [Moorella glycerini]GEA13993.1 hypothetical protein E308F_02330 [Moorella sp. E308F]GEA18634.1 hypothetical protein E306M_17710 [Moorella sp. E306M]
MGGHGFNFWWLFIPIIVIIIIPIFFIFFIPLSAANA